MNKKFCGVWATFQYLDDFCNAIKELRNQDKKKITTYSPCPRHEIFDALGNPVSRVPFFTLAMGMYALFIQVTGGLEISGISHPIGWGVYITDFVFWVGIAHAGTLISAVLFLTRAPYRTSIYRTAEAMTVFAVMTAGLFPIIHVGRIWNAYWLVPYPNQRELWVNFKSPLLWDVFAVSTRKIPLALQKDETKKSLFHKDFRYNRQ